MLIVFADWVVHSCDTFQSVLMGSQFIGANEMPSGLPANLKLLPQESAVQPVRKLLSPILVPDNPAHHANLQEETAMVQTRIKPYYQQVAEKARRAEQTRLYRRNQALGLVLVAAAILLWWLFHTNPKWIFPPGWWRP
jgi:hypothetical protein